MQMICPRCHSSWLGSTLTLARLINWFLKQSGKGATQRCKWPSVWIRQKDITRCKNQVGDNDCIMIAVLSAIKGMANNGPTVTLVPSFVVSFYNRLSCNGKSFSSFPFPRPFLSFIIFNWKKRIGGLGLWFCVYWADQHVSDRKGQ